MGGGLSDSSFSYCICHLNRLRHTLFHTHVHVRRGDWYPVCAPLVRGLVTVCSPVTWPLGKLLDCVLG